jgi:hypothetical protein
VYRTRRAKTAASCTLCESAHFALLAVAWATSSRDSLLIVERRKVESLGFDCDRGSRGRDADGC